MKSTPGQLVGRYIRESRVSAGLSQVEFAERCGFYQTYLSRLEGGHANPTLNALDVIAAALDMTVFDFFANVQQAHQMGRLRPPVKKRKKLARA